MRSPPRRALTRLSILALSMLSITGCAGTQLSPPILAAIRCPPLIPQSFRQPIPAAPLLQTPATVGDLGARLDADVAALDRANGRTADVIAIVDACDARQQAVLQALAPAPWWQSLAGRLLGHGKPATAAPAPAAGVGR